jgi:hypothetical protein
LEKAYAFISKYLWKLFSIPIKISKEVYTGIQKPTFKKCS